MDKEYVKKDMRSISEYYGRVTLRDALRAFHIQGFLDNDLASCIYKVLKVTSNIDTILDEGSFVVVEYGKIKIGFSWETISVLKIDTYEFSSIVIDTTYMLNLIHNELLQHGD